MRKVKIRSRLVACIGAVFALVLLVGAAVLKIQTQPASAKGSERQADTSFVLSSWGSVPAGGGYYTSLFKFYRNGQLMFHAYCASGNQNTPGIGGTYDVEVHKVDAETDPDDKFMKMFKIIYYSTQGGQHGYYGQAAIHWAVTAVNFEWTEQYYPYTVGAYPYKYINEPWPEGLSYGNVYYLNNDGPNNYTQSIVAAGWEKATTRTLNLDKVWLDSNGEPESEDVVGQHESVTVGVYKKLSEDGSGDALVGEVVLSKDSGWQGSIEVDDGYEYYVKEISSTPGYVMDSTCSKNSYVCKIVNTKLDKVRVSWEKTWEDHGFEANRPKSVKVAIQRTLNGVRDSDFGTKVFTMTESKCGVGDYKWHCYISGFDKNVEVDGQLEALEPLGDGALHGVLTALQAGAQHIDLSARMGKDDEVIVEVANDGAPIPPAAQEQIFVPFYTTKKDGSGIGLSLARQIMRQHNGSIDLVKSDAAETVFQMVFR
jgi:hypothetical protein